MSKAITISARTKCLIRFFDVIFSITALLILLPIFIIVAVILRFTGEHKILYRQTRIGRNGQKFKLLKFVTMLKDSQILGTGELTLPNDSRVLPVGRILRKTKINELPQLWNVLSGDLSFIGPRPQTMGYYLCFLKEDQELMSRVRPGLSGIGSILFRNEEHILAEILNPEDFDKYVIMPYKGQVESWFVTHQSLSLYFELLLTTIKVVILPNSKLNKSLKKRIPIPPKLLSKYI